MCFVQMLSKLKAQSERWPGPALEATAMVLKQIMVQQRKADWVDAQEIFDFMVQNVSDNPFCLLSLFMGLLKKSKNFPWASFVQFHFISLLLFLYFSVVFVCLYVCVFLFVFTGHVSFRDVVSAHSLGFLENKQKIFIPHSTPTFFFHTITVINIPFCFPSIGILLSYLLLSRMSPFLSVKGKKMPSGSAEKGRDLAAVFFITFIFFICSHINFKGMPWVDYSKNFGLCLRLQNCVCLSLCMCVCILMSFTISTG